LPDSSSLIIINNDLKGCCSMLHSNIVFFEKNEIIREGFRSTLKLDSSHYIWYTNSFSETFNFIKNSENKTFAVIIGTTSLEVSDLGLFEQLIKTNEGLKFIFLIWGKNLSLISKLLKLRPDAILFNPSRAQELEHAIKNIKSGETFFSMSKLNNKDLSEIEGLTGRLLTLSDREREILELVGKGFTSRQIAEMINLSHYTIENHRKNMLKKTKAKNIVELINSLPQ